GDDKFITTDYLQQCRMVYRRAIAGLNVSGLKKNARDISLLRYMPA
ncbi:hypothetical protein PBR70_25235, partial [Escherichia coli]